MMMVLWMVTKTESRKRKMMVLFQLHYNHQENQSDKRHIVPSSNEFVAVGHDDDDFDYYDVRCCSEKFFWEI